MRRFIPGGAAVWLVCALALGDGGLGRVAAFVRTGDHSAALRAIAALPEEKQDDEGVRYLRGRLLLDSGRPCDAMEPLAQTPPSLPEPMRLDARRRWARAAARCGSCEEARPILLGADANDVAVTRRDRAVAADCAFQLGDLETAAEELAALTHRRSGLPSRVALLALLSDVYLELGREDEARDAARQAWIAAVGPGQRRAAQKLEDRAALTAADRMDHAEALMRARRFGEAVKVLERLELSADDPLREQWHHVYGMALFRTRKRYLDAARILHVSESFGGPHAIEDAFHSARALSRADEDARAIRAYRRFAQRYPKSKRASEARFLAAWLEIRLGRQSGEKQMERLVRGKRQVRGRWRRAALWELGFRAFETRRYARAARYLSQYAKLATSSMEEARGLYWLGRSYRRGPRAVESYRGAIAVEPLHWYAVLAAHRLERLKVEPPRPFDDAQSFGQSDLPSAPLAVPDTFEAYRRLGLDGDGVAWLTGHETELTSSFPSSQRVPLLAGLYGEVGAYREALRTARRRMVYLRSDPAQHRWWWDAAYPMPWLSIVDAHRGDLPRGLVYATMRQESGFQAGVISRAGAVGLMQVMPEVATKLAGRRVTRSELRSPEANIALGLKEMKALADELDRVYPLSIAAYNAGKSRVRRWLRESGRMELDRFVERIPFNETRNYVRRVGTHYARYTYLDAPESGWPALPRFVSP